MIQKHRDNYYVHTNTVNGTLRPCVSAGCVEPPNYSDSYHGVGWTIMTWLAIVAMVAMCRVARENGISHGSSQTTCSPWLTDHHQGNRSPKDLGTHSHSAPRIFPALMVRRGGEWIPGMPRYVASPLGKRMNIVSAAAKV